MANKTTTDLIKFVNDKVSKDKNRTIKADTKLLKEQVIDSINVLTLVGYVEDKLGRHLTEKELVMSNFESVGSIVKAFFE